MSTFIAVTVSGLALGSIYFLVASGLSLIFGLMDVLNFAHGVFLTLGAYAGWQVASHLGTALGSEVLFIATVAASIAAGAIVAALTEILLIRPLYGRVIAQILVTVGLDMALVGLLTGAFSSNSQAIVAPGWLTAVVTIGAVRIPGGDFLAVGAGVAVLGLLSWFLQRTRYGLIVRAGAENREMVRALGIDVGRAFTLVFLIGGAAAGLAGLLNSLVLNSGLVDPTQGDQLLIFAFIVVVIGGMGSLKGAAIAAVIVAFVQVYVNFYIGSSSGLADIGNVSVVLFLALLISVRPKGLATRT
ncbi:MAG: branched-chain amino acid ABC transporter permease [Solirubrobacteraceae bacterium]